jgi:hypothetical protein
MLPKTPSIKLIGEYIPWLELLDIHTASEDWVDEWLAKSETGGAGTSFRIDTGGEGLRLPNQPVTPRPTVARVTRRDWNSDVSRVTNHVSGILSQLGNAKKP